MLTRLLQAAGLSLTGQESRKYRFGAIGERRDGAIVTATNGGVAGARTPSAHAEARLSRKLDVQSVVYVARTRDNGQIALAKPCKGCQIAMKHRGIAKCFYTISDTEYGCICF